MGYIDKNLLPGEQIIFRTKKHFIIFLVPFLFLALAIFFSMDNLITREMNHTFNIITHSIPGLNAIHRFPAFLFLFAMAFSGLQQWIVYQTSEYVVTNKRVIMREGLVDRRTSDLRISTISSVNIDQGLLAQMLNYGNISINGFGGQKDDFIQIAAPIEFQKSVHVQLDDAKPLS
jgi:uncharacterized membrane protein YdbT with pleckstrin-like domain